MKQEIKNEQGNTYYTVDYIKDYIKDKNLIYATWEGEDLALQQIKDAALLGLSYIKEYKANKLINDNRKLEGSWDEANDWISEIWMPQALEAGLLKFAHIVSDDIYAKISAEFMKMENEVEDGTFQLKLFDNEKEALQWIEK